MRKSDERAESAGKIKKSAVRALSAHDDLFELLRGLRRAIAKEEGVPPYVVFTDKTLAAICETLPAD